jgi:hypothetical protein
MTRTGITLNNKPFFGTEEVEGDPSRKGRCYELSCYALVFGTAPPNSILVHGSIHGPDDDMERIAHAWLELPNGKVWEPYTHSVYVNWLTFAEPREERRYTRYQAIRMVRQTGTWGAWHDVTWPVRDADTGKIIRSTQPARSTS